MRVTIEFLMLMEERLQWIILMYYINLAIEVRGEDNMSLRYVDTFCGLGGFSIALHNIDNNAELVYAVDINKDAAKTFETNFNFNPLGDITKINYEDIPDHDIIFGGFPCQPFSRSGKWYNSNNKTISNDERSNLFLNLVGILKVKQPLYFIFENVKELTKIKNEEGELFFDVIVDALTSCGYKVYTKILNSKHFGVPQSRDRVYFVGIRVDINQSFAFPVGCAVNTALEDILDKEETKQYAWSKIRKNGKILCNENHEGKQLKNHPFDEGESRNKVFKYLLSSSKNKPKERTGEIELICSLLGDTPSGQSRQQDRIYSVKGISPTITRMIVPSILDKSTVRELSPREAARLQAIPESFKLPINNKKAYNQIGNAVTVSVVEAILKNLLNKRESK
jgi:DNA (cytosine-5)-methyltransferase 1